MDVHVDLGLCQGYGNCVTTAPEFFDLDDAGQVLVLKDVAATEEEQALVREAMAVCPMSAISLA